MSYVSTILAESGLVGFWELAEPSGTTATDQTANSSGTYTNTSGITLGQTGIPGAGGLTACRFTAASLGYVSIPTVLANRVTDVLSYEAWVKRASTGAFMGILCGGTSRTGELRFNSDDKIAVLSSAFSAIATSTGTLTDTTSFHHIVWTKNTTTNVIYLDGAAVTGAVTNSTLNQNASGYLIGAEQSGTPTFYQNGTIQMAAVYNVELSSGQVANHYALGVASGAVHSGFFGLM